MQIFGRSSSHFTRLPRLFAEELHVAYELVPIFDMRELDSHLYGGHPAMKLPALRDGTRTVFGAHNICRVIAEHSTASAQLIWPEDLRDDLSRNAQELVWHCMAAQVQWVFGTQIAKLPPENIFFIKTRSGLAQTLGWLDAHLEHIQLALPPTRTLSMFEASLFCLVDHLAFRPTVETEPFTALRAFAQAFSERESAQRTYYRIDPKPM